MIRVPLDRTFFKSLSISCKAESSEVSVDVKPFWIDDVFASTCVDFVMDNEGLGAAKRNM